MIRKYISKYKYLFLCIFAMIITLYSIGNSYNFISNERNPNDMFLHAALASEENQYTGEDYTLNLEYNLDDTNMVASVSLGEAVDTSIIVPSIYKIGILEYSIISIANSGFTNSKISSITLPDSISIIGNQAFAHCLYLNSFEFPTNVTAINSSTFNACKYLQNITYKDNVGAKITDIYDHAFEGCLYLKQFKFPSGLVSIHEAAFSNCISLKGLTFPASLKNIKELAFYNCYGLTMIYVPRNLVNIEKFSFRGVTSYCTAFFELTKTEIETIETSGTLANNWDRLVNDDGSTSSYNYLKRAYDYNTAAYDQDYIYLINANNEAEIFQYIGYDTEILLPATLGGYPVVTILEDAFSYNSSVCGRITLFSSAGCPTLKKINNTAFKGSYSLETLVLNEGLEYVMNSAFDPTTNTQTSNKVKVLHIPSTVIKIEPQAFINFRNLEELYFDKALEGADIGQASITYIGQQAFKDGGSYLSDSDFNFELPESLLKNVKWSSYKPFSYFAFEFCGFIGKISFQDTNKYNKMYTIEKKVFAGCKNLKDIDFSDYIYEIGAEVFSNCKKLTNVFIPKETVKITKNSFSRNHNIVLYLEGLKTKYTNYPFTNGDSVGPDSLTVDTIPSYFEVAKEDLLSFDDVDYIPLKLNGNISHMVASKYRYVSNNNVTIKDKINVNGRDYFVKEIGISCFLNNSSINSVSLPDTIETISDFSFANANKLNEISYYLNLNPTSKHINKLPPSLLKISKRSLYSLGSNASNKFILFIPSSAILFEPEYRLEELNTSPTNSQTQNGTLMNLNNILGFEIYQSDGQQELTSGGIESRYMNFDGGLYIKEGVTVGNLNVNGKILYQIPRGIQNTNLNIAPNTKIIGQDAGKQLLNVDTINFNDYDGEDTIITIMGWAFTNSTKFSTLELPTSIQYIGNSAFKNCASLLTINTNVGSLDLRNHTNLKSINNVAFINNKNITKIFLPHTGAVDISNLTSPLYIGANVFGCNNDTVELFSGDKYFEYYNSYSSENANAFAKWDSNWNAKIKSDKHTYFYMEPKFFNYIQNPSAYPNDAPIDEEDKIIFGTKRYWTIKDNVYYKFYAPNPSVHKYNVESFQI